MKIFKYKKKVETRAKKSFQVYDAMLKNIKFYDILNYYRGVFKSIYAPYFSKK